MRMKTNKKIDLKALLVASVVLILILVLGLAYRAMTKPSITYMGTMELSNKTFHIYKVTLVGDALYYYCIDKIPKGSKCLVTPLMLLCDNFLPCYRFYGVVTV